MGFPVCYSDLLLPRLFLHFLLLLGALRRFLMSIFRAVGLGDLLEFDEPPVPGIQFRRPELNPLPSVVIDEALPVFKFRDLDSRVEENPESVCCAVCLYDVTGGDEVRRLSNCTHVFHRGCIDRWIEHDQHTCPLCRAQLIPDEMGSCCLGFTGTGTGTDDVQDLFSDYDYFFPDLPSSALPSPVFFQAHQLIGGRS